LNRSRGEYHLPGIGKGMGEGLCEGFSEGIHLAAFSFAFTGGESGGVKPPTVWEWLVIFEWIVEIEDWLGKGSVLHGTEDAGKFEFDPDAFHWARARGRVMVLWRFASDTVLVD
jgi:hypothetical protein